MGNSVSTRDVIVELLGGFSVHLDGRRVEDAAWSARRPAELVQLLALADGHSLLREQVLEALWPHLDPEAGAANLRKAAHHARRAIGEDDAVVLQGGGVSLFPGRTVRTDLAAFLDAGQRAVASGEVADAVAALAHWSGELLPDARYEDWARADADRAHQRYLDLLRTAGRWREVVAADPTDEAAYQALMREALDAGTRSLAVRWYGRLRQVLARELGVSPDPASVALYERCIEGLPPVETELVGREVEESAVLAAFDAGRGHRGGAVLVRGAAGIGKTAFCRSVTRRAEAACWTAHWLDGAEGGTAYQPLVGLIERIVLARRETLTSVPDHVRSVLGVLTPVAGTASEAPGPLSRHQVVGVLEQVARIGERPMVFVLDDADVADDATVEALGHVAASVHDAVVVLVSRDVPTGGGLAQVTSRLARSDRLLDVELGPLDPDAAADLVASIAGRDVPDDRVDDIVRRGAGNPFVVGELAKAAGPARRSFPVPSPSEVVTGRLVRLAAADVSVLRRLALAEGDLDVDHAIALGGGDEHDVLTVLDRALDAGVVVVDGERYRIFHDLVRDALAEQLAPHERSAVHRDAARRLADAGAAPATIARHWSAAGRPAEAAPWLVEAARHAMELGAFVDACRSLDEVLAHAPDHPVANRLRAEALDLRGEPQALAAYDRAIAVAPAIEAQDLVAMRALAQIKQGDPVGALAAIEGATPTSVMGRLSEALTYAGAAALGVADPAFGTVKAAEARRIALASGDTSAIVIASWAQAAAAHARGELHDSVLADLRDTSDIPALALRVFDGQLCITQRFLYGARPYDDVIAFADNLADEGARLGAARAHAFGVVLRGEAELLAGRLDEAEDDLQEGGRLHRRIGGATGEALSLQRRAELAIHRGDRVRAAALLAEALELARVTDIGFHLLDRIYGTRIDLADDPEEARAAVDEAADAVRGPLETCPGCRITFAVPAAIACARAGDVEAAREYAAATEWLAHTVMRLPAWDAAHEEVLGHLAAAEGDRQRAVEHFATAVDGFAAAGQPLDRDRCAALAAPA